MHEWDTSIVSLMFSRVEYNQFDPCNTTYISLLLNDNTHSTIRTPVTQISQSVSLLTIDISEMASHFMSFILCRSIQVSISPCHISLIRSHSQQSLFSGVWEFSFFQLDFILLLLASAQVNITYTNCPLLRSAPITNSVLKWKFFMSRKRPGTHSHSPIYNAFESASRQSLLLK